jgi:hypothetical protein
MDDIKIGRALEEEMVKEEEKVLSDLAEEDLNANFSIKEDGKNIAIMVVVIAGLFALMLGGFKLYGGITSANVVNVDQLHVDNLEGNLDNEEGYVYEGFSFVKVDGLWWTEVKNLDRLLKIPLHFGPKEVEDIEISGSLSDRFNLGEEIFIAINPNVANKYYTLSISELSFNVAKGVGRNPIGACTEENEACDNRTIISCDNNQGKPVIELELSENPAEIEYIGSCIKIKGDGYDLVKAVDRILYKWYGVMS